MIILKDNRKYCFAMEMSVRDYELDCESIVNNANYLHYMEHTRHSFCAEAGMSFVKLHEAGVDVVVRKIEIEYKQSLRGGDRFVSCLRLERQYLSGFLYLCKNKSHLCQTTAQATKNFHLFICF